MERVNELIKREIGTALFTIMREKDYDQSAVTVTHVRTSRNLRHADVLISILDHKDDRDHILSLIKRHRVELQGVLNRNLTLKYTPKLSFSLDTSLERGDNVIKLLSEIKIDDEQEHDEPQEEKQP
jgi:ribosome-binding factor A